MCTRLGRERWGEAPVCGGLGLNGLPPRLLLAVLVAGAQRHQQGPPHLLLLRLQLLGLLLAQAALQLS